MLIGSLLSDGHPWRAEAAAIGTLVWQGSVDTLTAAARAPVDLLLVDAGDLAVQDLPDLNAYRIARPATRILVALPPDAQPGDPLFEALARMGVYDMTSETALAAAIANTASYADAARWLPPPEASQPAPRGSWLFAQVAASRRSAWRRDIAAGPEPTPHDADDAPAAPARGRRPVLVAGRSIAILAAHGGAGATTVTALLAQVFAAQGLHVGILEADPGGGQLLRLFGRPLLEAGVESAQSPAEALVACGPRISVLARGFGAGAALGTPDVERSLSYLRGISDVTLVDAGRGTVGLGIAGPYADLLVLVAEPTPTGAAAAVRIANLLKTTRVPQLAGAVLNRRPTKRLTAADLGDALGCRILADIPALPAECFHLADSGRAGKELLGFLGPVADMLLTQRRAAL